MSGCHASNQFNVRLSSSKCVLLPSALYQFYILYLSFKEHNMPTFEDWTTSQVLGVDCKCSDRELTKAYRKLALKHHPDKSDQAVAWANGWEWSVGKANCQDNSGETFQRITKARDELSGVEKSQKIQVGLHQSREVLDCNSLSE